MTGEVKRQRFGDDTCWMEGVQDDEGAHLRGPVEVIGQVVKWAEKDGYRPHEHLKKTKEKGGIIRLTGTKAEMKKFIRSAKKGGPGPLLRLVMED